MPHEVDVILKKLKSIDDLSHAQIYGTCCNQLVSLNYKTIKQMNCPEADKHGASFGIFCCAGKCTNPRCMESDYFIIGYHGEEECDGPEGVEFYTRHCIKSSVPGVMPIQIEEHLPKSLRKNLEEVYVALWSNLDAAVNKSRVFIEQLLNHYGVNKYREILVAKAEPERMTAKHGKQVKLPAKPATYKEEKMNLYHRIEFIKGDDRFKNGPLSKCIENLHAIRALGNDGSHESGFDESDLETVIHSLSEIIRICFDKRTAQLHKRVKAVTERGKKPAKKKPASTP